MSAADINAKVQAAITAQEAGDYNTALTYLRSAQALLAVEPDATTSRGSSLSYDRAAIASLIQQMTRLRNASRGIQRTKINYVNPCDDD
jgi:hypothetical protein